MSRDAGGFLYHFIRLNLALLYGVLLWAAFQYPVYATDNYYYVDTVSWSVTGSISSSYPNRKNVYLGPFDDTYLGTLTSQQENEICDDLSNQFLSEMMTELSAHSITVTGQIEHFKEYGSPPIPSGPLSLSWCFWRFSTNGNDLTFSLLLKVQRCDAGSGVTATANSFSCAGETYQSCEDWGANAPSIEGFLPTQLTEPQNYCYNLFDGSTVIDECKWNFQHLAFVYDENNLLSGRNLRLTPTPEQCPDQQALFVNELLPLGVDDPDEPEQTEGGGAEGGANDPFQPPPEYHAQPEPSTITDQTALLQNLLEMAQDTYNSAREQQKELRDINQELNYQTDVLTGLHRTVTAQVHNRRASSNLENCTTAPACSGDAIDCAILREQWAHRCQDKTDSPGDAESLTAAQQDAAAFMTAEGDTWLAGTTYDFENMLDDDPRYSSTCPAPETFTVYDHSMEISYEPLCGIAPAIKPWILMSGYLTAAFIIFRAV
jgi:hypothetical protein